MSVVIGIIVGLLMLMFLVTAHEFGHFLAARRSGVEVEEFGICFPPRAIAWRKVNGKWKRLKKSEWDNPPGEGLILSLNWLPIGGFCQMKGESDADTARGSFGRAGYLAKTKILFAGVAFNWAVAFVILTILAFIGAPKFLDNQFTIESDEHAKVLVPVTVDEVYENSPADRGGIRADDVIREVRIVGCEGDNNEDCYDDRVVVNLIKDFTDFNKQYAGKTVFVTYERNNSRNITEVKLNEDGSDYLFGANLMSDVVYRSTWSAPIVGAGLTLQMTGETFKGLGRLVYDLFSGVFKQLSPNEDTRKSGASELEEAGNSVTGPVGIIGILFPAFVADGARSLLFLVALISVSLACMNVLPIPALDGGRWTMITIARLRKKRLSQEKEEKIVGRAFIVILALAALVTLLDILKLVK